MENFILELPNTPIGFFGLILGVVFLTLIFVNRIRSNDLVTLRQSNEDLRASIEDKGHKIDELMAEMTLLRKEFEELTTRHSIFESLIVKALSMYFTENPTVATDIKDKVRRKK